MAEVVPTDAERQQAAQLLDDLTFGGHSHDGAASQLAYALACARASQGEERAKVVEFVTGRRRDALRALRASVAGGGSDYWRWQGHAELSRQVLELMGEEVPH